VVCGLAVIAVVQLVPVHHRYMPGWPPGSGYHPALLLTPKY